MHLDDERIQRLLDGELGDPDDRAVREHVQDCPTCRAALERATVEDTATEARLAHLDRPAPDLDPRALLRRWDRERQGGRSRRLAWAASILILLAVAGAAWAVPGSPVPRWLESLRAGARPRSTAVSPADVPSPPIAGGPQARGDDLLILLPARRTGWQLRIRPTDEPLVTVQTVRGRASFTDAAGGHRLGVEPLGASGILRIDVPRSASRVEIRLEGRRVFLQEGGRVQVAPPPDSGGVWALPLATGPGPGA
ncbi:MAG TPA: zf-HC2 domain-containing protein [Longimicrobiales bacterium]|nr:zf-HC2 domain-containing protein [Longimicrobiales bacterium]